MEYEPGVEGALKEVREKGLQDHKEHVVVIRDGKVIFHGDGDGFNVNFADAHPQAGDIVVHNHPNSKNSLSDVDIVQVFIHKLTAMYAITDDGSVYRAKLGTNPVVVADPSADKFMEAFGVTDAVVHEARYALTAQDFDGYKLSEAHWVNRVLGHSGIIQYDYSLSAESADAIAKIDSELKFPEEW